jgi:hypothetical protein
MTELVTSAGRHPDFKVLSQRIGAWINDFLKGKEEEDRKHPIDEDDSSWTQPRPNTRV